MSGAVAHKHIGDTCGGGLVQGRKTTVRHGGVHDVGGNSLLVGIDDGGEILAGLSLDTRLHYGKVTDVVAALEFSALQQMKMGVGSEEQGASQESASGDDHHSAAIVGTLVDDCLQLLGLNGVAVVRYTVVGDYIFRTEAAQRGHLVV